MIAKYIGIYTPEELEGLFKGLSDMNAKYVLEYICLEIDFVCKIIGDKKFPESSFFKEPLSYLLDKTGERMYKKAIKNLIQNMNCDKEYEKYLTLHFLNYAKDMGNFIPKVILDEMNKFPKEKYNYLEKLMNN
jgi:hypothetical protein